MPISIGQATRQALLAPQKCARKPGIKQIAHMAELTKTVTTKVARWQHTRNKQKAIPCPALPN